jgi:hypothetical protein
MLWRNVCYQPWIYLKGLRKTMGNLSFDNSYPGRNFNLKPPEDGVRRLGVCRCSLRMFKIRTIYLFTYLRNSSARCLLPRSNFRLFDTSRNIQQPALQIILFKSPHKSCLRRLNIWADTVIASIDQTVAAVSYHRSAPKQRNTVASFVRDYNANDEWEPSLLRVYGFFSWIMKIVKSSEHGLASFVCLSVLDLFICLRIV